jgi:ribosomal protein L35
MPKIMSTDRRQRYRVTGGGHVKRGRPYGHLLDMKRQRKRACART